ncbi:hypothetical protein LCGC14_2175810, partial [marine sediment metagenome]
MLAMWRRSESRRCHDRRTRNGTRLGVEQLEGRLLLSGTNPDFGPEVWNDATPSAFLNDSAEVGYVGRYGYAGINSTTSPSRTGPSLDAVDLSPDLPSGQRVGTKIKWTVAGSGSGSEVYRFSVARFGERPRMMYDFRADNVFEWTPIEDGQYLIIAHVRDLATNSLNASFSFFQVRPTLRAQLVPVVTPTDNPLIALYSAPDSSQKGDSMRVHFLAPGEGMITANVTSPKPTQSGHTMNFYIAGMRADTLYAIRHEILDTGGKHVEFGPWRTFTTGSLPFPFPPAQVVNPPTIGDALGQKVVLHSTIIGNVALGIPAFPYAMDLQAEVIWFLDQENSGLWRTVDGGTFLQHDAGSLREVDLMGNVLRETNLDRINRQLTKMGQDVVNNIHHEARPLPNGHTAILAAVEKILEDVQGPGPVDILGDMVVVLDENFQVVWTWNGFEHLDVTRAAVLGETCSSDAGGGCPPVLLADEANDWMHSNAITYDETDGNLLISMRHQDWIIKIDYADGLGNGDIVWRL